MVKYKTYQVVKMLSENKRLMFRPLGLDAPSDLVLSVDNEGYLKGYSHLYEYNININDEWYLEEEAVALDKALVALVEGKEISCFLDGEFTYYGPTKMTQLPLKDSQGYGISLGELLFGIWFINSEEEYKNE